MQAQIKICNAAYCDFVVWTEDEIVTTKIWPDENFIKDAITLVTAFFKNGILPELLANWYSRLPPPKAVADHDNMYSSHHLPTSCEPLSQTIDSSDNFEGESWCFCGGEENGEMIACDCDSCSIAWFHTDCLDIYKNSDGEWFCPDCV